MENKKIKVVVIDDNGNEISLFVRDAVAGASLADELFKTTDNTVKVINTSIPDGTDKVIYQRTSPKHAFLSASKDFQENRLMETAMRFMDVLCDMQYAHSLNPDKLDESSYLEKLEMLRDWAREFEYTCFGIDKYENDWISFAEDWITPKLVEKFGGEC